MIGWLFISAGHDLSPAFAAVSLLAPWWAWALTGAVGVPLVAHLLSRRGGRVMDFPATRFVRQAVTDTSRMLRPRHWLLMLLRIAALALLVAAFMQPVWLDAKPLAGERGLLVSLLVDRSASMTRTADGATLFDEARRRALNALDELDPSRDRATIILIDAQPQPLLPEPTGNFSELRARLRAAEPTHERGDIAAALSMAMQTPGDPPARRLPHLELFTDAQATTWPGQALSSAAARGIALRTHHLAGPTDNIALRRPRVEPTTPIAGQPALVSVEVANLGEAPRRVTVRFEAPQDGDRSVTLDAGATARLSWRWTPEAVGANVLRFALMGADDALPLDDAVGRVVEVAPARPITLLTAADPQDPDTTAFFVSRALVPGEQGDTGVALRTRPPDAAPDISRDDAPGTWFIFDAGRLPDATLTAMRDHLAAGGGVVWVIDSADATAQLGELPDDLRVIEPEAWRIDQRTLANARFDDPLLAVFEGAARSGLVDQPIRASMQGRLATAAEPLMIFDDGTPAAATRWVGPGRIAVLGFPLNAAATDLPKGPAFVGLMQQLAHHLAPGRPLPPNPQPGDMVQDITAERVGLLQDEMQTQTPRAWVELHPDESDLRVAEEPASKIAAAAGTTADLAPPPLRTEAQPLWPYLVLAALLLLIAEGAALLAWSSPSSTTPLPVAQIGAGVRHA